MLFAFSASVAQQGQVESEPVIAGAMSVDAGVDASRLDVSVAVLDPGLPEDESTHREQDVFPRIRNIEALFLPFVIRQTLVETGEWGAVRVVPEPDPAAEVLVTGTIVHSDGETLTLHVRAADATGRTWVNTLFTGNVADDYADVDPDTGTPSYQALYDAIASDLFQASNKLNNKDKTAIREVSLLRYGQQIAPAVFGDFVTTSPDGAITVNRLPAKNDPMIERIALVRGTEYVITDAVDAKYRELNAEIASVYDVWREFRRKTLHYAKEDARRAAETADDGARGSYESLRNVYDNYKFHRVTEQEQDRLAVAFFVEVGPRIEAIEARVAEMQEWVDEKYAEWRRILEELFEVETGQS
jgi:hypothetical protein